MYANVKEFCKMQCEVARQLKSELKALTVEMEYREVFPTVLVEEREHFGIDSIFGDEWPLIKKSLRFLPAKYTKRIPESTLLFETNRRKARVEVCFSIFFDHFLTEVDVERMVKILQKTLKTQIYIRLFTLDEDIFYGMEVEINKNPSKILK